MAPTDINLSQTRRWLAQLHTTNLPPAPASSSSSSTHSGGSADYSPGTSTLSSTGSSPGGFADLGSPATTTTAAAAASSPLTEARAKSLQRLCEMGDAHSPIPASSVNERFAPSNINYIKTGPDRWSAGGEGGPASTPDAAASPTMGRSRWSRKLSGQSLEALEGSSMRRFSLSKFKLR
ncbi:hypothetical protein IF1G_03769 [Cordyceps javanica]|uniref:Uncharacterized protein n=1 Tax=Cordyceps javanica TaxID=43265 RepID=A0A545W4A9_9HYPO|nr:hypothetical protein IF1G_03769 [Cordyceps javanica]TQW08794.1 hypothetical protein IF2G_03225 [Cordyceps javanica]